MVRRSFYLWLVTSLFVFMFFPYTDVLAHTPDCDHGLTGSGQNNINSEEDEDTEDVNDSYQYQKKKEKKKKNKNKSEGKPKSFIRGEIEEPILELDDD